MQLKLHMVTIEDLMPQDHFLQKLEAALDLSFVYEETHSCTATRKKDCRHWRKGLDTAGRSGQSRSSGTAA